MTDPDGTVYFAWAADDEPFNADLHARWDEPVFRIGVAEVEGQPATARITIRNPGQGLLHADRARFCIVSIRLDGAVQHVFSGLVAGAVESVQGGLIVVPIKCVATDNAAREQAAFNALKQLPYYEPLLQETNPDATETPDIMEGLEARTEVYHYDYRSHTVRMVNMVSGERLVDIGSSYIDGSYQTRLLDLPPEVLTATLTCNFEQRFWQIEDIGSAVMAAWDGAAGATLTPDGVLSAWPKYGSDLSGWRVISSRAEKASVLIDPKTGRRVAWGDRPPDTVIQQPQGKRLFTDSYRMLVSDSERWVVRRSGSGSTAKADKVHPLVVRRLKAAISYLTLECVARAYRHQMRSETVTIKLPIARQALLGNAPEVLQNNYTVADVTLDPTTQSWQANEEVKVGDKRRFAGQVWASTAERQTGANWLVDQQYWQLSDEDDSPIRDVGARSFLQTERGRQTVEHVMLRLKRLALNACRCIEHSVRLPVPMALRLGITCADAVRLVLPTGQAVMGKVVDTSLDLAPGGDAGDSGFTLTIRPCIGVGGELEPEEGDVVRDDIAYPDYLGTEPPAAYRATTHATVKNPLPVQEAALQANDYAGSARVPQEGDDQPDGDALQVVSSKYPTSVTITPPPVTSPGTLNFKFTVECRPWRAPLQQDLAA